MAKQPKTLIVTRTQLADLLGLQPDSITRYVSQGMPVIETGSGRGRTTKFNLRDALRWWIQADPSARERLWLVQAERAEFDLQVKRGEFITVDEAVRDGANVSRAVCMKLRAVPNAQIDQVLTIGARAGRAPAAAFLLARIDDALRELAALAEPRQEAEAS
jgi:phage terminase Nu1 subunit (DNA packaging protein)